MEDIERLYEALRVVAKRRAPSVRVDMERLLLDYIGDACVSKLFWDTLHFSEHVDDPFVEYPN